MVASKLAADGGVQLATDCAEVTGADGSVRVTLLVADSAVTMRVHKQWLLLLSCLSCIRRVANGDKRASSHGCCQMWEE